MSNYFLSVKKKAHAFLLGKTLLHFFYMFFFYDLYHQVYVMCGYNKLLKKYRFICNFKITRKTLILKIKIHKNLTKFIRNLHKLI